LLESAFMTSELIQNLSQLAFIQKQSSHDCMNPKASLMDLMILLACHSAFICNFELLKQNAVLRQ
ncbi:MAG: hypothetical protein K2H94_01840, partial [Duncaniella sp.]|nr:hypothetical protein [Duncaniella sp.]